MTDDTGCAAEETSSNSGRGPPSLRGSRSELGIATCSRLHLVVDLRRFVPRETWRGQGPVRATCKNARLDSFRVRPLTRARSGSRDLQERSPRFVSGERARSSACDVQECSRFVPGETVNEGKVQLRACPRLSALA
jgi:hypothetical protein